MRIGVVVLSTSINCADRLWCDTFELVRPLRLIWFASTILYRRDL